MSRLGEHNARAAATSAATTAAAPTPVARFRQLGARGELVTLPLLGPAWIELAGHRTANEIEAATFAEMKRLGFDLALETALTFEAERNVRTLAACVRDPDDHNKPFGTLDEWRDLDTDLVAACNQIYGDVRVRLDPLGAESLSDDDRASIALALEKKSAMGLRYFGVAKLSLYLLAMASQPATSPTALSSSGPSSSTTAEPSPGPSE